MSNRIKFLMLSLLAILLASATPIWAIQPVTIEGIGEYPVYQFYERTSTDAVTAATHTVAGILLSWSVESVSGQTTFFINHSTGTDFTIQKSSAITVRSGQIFTDDVRGMVKNPSFLINSVGAGATAYIRFIYLAPK